MRASDNLKKNQFGGFAGRPIIRDKLFIFGNHQANWQSLTATQNTANTPTAAMLSGDFSGVVDQNGNSIPLHGTPGQPNPFMTVNGKPNQVNPALSSAGAPALVMSIPVGQNVIQGGFFRIPAQVTDYNEGTGRLDYSLSYAQRMFSCGISISSTSPGPALRGTFSPASRVRTASISIPWRTITGLSVRAY